MVVCSGSHDKKVNLGEVFRGLVLNLPKAFGGRGPTDLGWKKGVCATHTCEVRAASPRRGLWNTLGRSNIVPSI